MPTTIESTAEPAEIARFDALASTWWDPSGPMRPLHRMNPVRTAWIHARIPPASQILDVGCGAGLLSEALARLGHTVHGIDAAGAALNAARAHAEGQGLPLTYRDALPEHLAAEPSRYTFITALEVIEHVPDPMVFVKTLASLLTPDGTLFLSTLNRTPKSFFTAKLAAGRHIDLADVEKLRVASTQNQKSDQDQEKRKPKRGPRKHSRRKQEGDAGESNRG